MGVWFWLWVVFMAVMCGLIFLAEMVRPRRRPRSPFRYNGNSISAVLGLLLAAGTLVFFMLM